MQSHIIYIYTTNAMLILQAEIGTLIFRLKCQINFHQSMLVDTEVLKHGRAIHKEINLNANLHLYLTR